MKRSFIIALVSFAAVVGGTLPAHADKPEICVGSEDPQDPGRLGVGYCFELNPDETIDRLDDIDLQLPPIPPAP